MAVGRISGPLLKSNLERNGIDLAFETDLLYLDVTGQKVGIKNSAPQHELDVTGTTRTTNLEVTTQADIADITISNSTISTSSSTLNIGTLDTVVSLNRLRVDSIDIENNSIFSNESNSNIELRPNGTGEVGVYSNLNVYGNIFTSGNITAEGNITVGDDSTDSVIFNAEVGSDIVPDETDTYQLGSDPALGGNQWNDVYVRNLFAGSIVGSADLQVEGIDLTLRNGSIFYVSENGDDTNTGTHLQDPVGTIKYALSLASSGDTVYINPGIYTEEFPLTVPVGVSVAGNGIRAVTVKPTTATRYNDAFLLNGETTVGDLTVKDFYSGGNFFEVTGTGAGTITINVGTTDQAHSYVSGGTIELSNSYTKSGSVATITNAVYTESTGVLVLTHSGFSGTAPTTSDIVFIKDITFSCSGDNRVFPDNGYALRFATDFEVTTRSPYIKNISVITSGSTTTVEDPRGFNAGDAGKGALVDGAYATQDSREASMLFHSVTFITPGVETFKATNGVRIEWLNSFTYFADKGLYCYNSAAGFAYNGKTRVRLSGISGTFSDGDVVTFTSTDASTTVVANVETVEGGDVLVIDGKFDDLDGFDTTPASIENAGALGTASTIENIDKRDFGAEVRMIGSACVYGNYGLYGDGDGVIVYAIGQNLAYIGNGKEVTNDPTTVIQDNEVIELNDAQIRYNSVDHKGDFRVGDLFYVNQDDGTVSFNVTDFTIDTSSGVTFTTGGDSTFIDGTRIDTGNWRISGNTIQTLSGDANFDAVSGTINLDDNVNITGNLDVTGNVTIGGNITIGDEASDTIQIVAGIDSDIVPSINSIYNLGTPSKQWANVYTNELNTDSIRIRDNFIETTVSNADLELRASGTGQILIPDNNVTISNSLNVGGASTLADTNINGDVTVTGTLTQTGDYTLAGNADITGTLSVGAEAQFEEILIKNNYITTTSSNADLELRASGTGKVFVPTNDVEITNSLTVVGNVTADNLTVNQLITAPRFTSTNIVIDDNFIETTDSNSDLELRANGTGVVRTVSDAVIEETLTVNGTTNLSDTNIIGDTTFTGDITQTGNTTIDGFLTVSQTINIQGGAQFENVLINDNFITTTESNSDLELKANGTGEVVVPDNNVNITNDLNVDGTITVNNITSTGTITANTFSTGDILIDDNFITTTQSNSNLELRANGTGDVLIPSNDVTLEQNLTVNGTTTLSETNITGDLTIVGDYTQTGNYDITGTLTVTGPVTISNYTQFEDVLIDGNVITTTQSNSDLELRANGAGNVVIPQNNVTVTNNLTVEGTLSTGNITSTGAIQANSFTTGDILIDDNFITTTLSNSNLELRTSGTGDVLVQDFAISDNSIASTGDFVIQSDTGIIDIQTTGALNVPTGTTGERPNPASSGQIRYNTSLSRFEGYNGSNWIKLNGVEDLNGNTSVTAELTEGANDNIIRFTTRGVVATNIDSNRLETNRIVIDEIQIDGNVISTLSSNTDLELSPQAGGKVVIDNFAIADNTILNTVSDSITEFENTGNGYVKFDGTYGMVIPAGTTGERPPLAFAETGMIRYNTTDGRTEIFDGTNWVSVAGAGAGITRSDAEIIAIETVLILG